MGEGPPPVGMFPKWPSELTGSSSPRAAAKATGYCRAGSETGLVAQRCLDSVRYPHRQSSPRLRVAPHRQAAAARCPASVLPKRDVPTAGFSSMMAAHRQPLDEVRQAAMATDYDAPRHNKSDAVVEDSLDVLKERHREAQSPAVDVEETDTAEGFELPGADLSGEELSVRVVPNKLTSSPARPAPRPPSTPLRRRTRHFQGGGAARLGEGTLRQERPPPDRGGVACPAGQCLRRQPPDRPPTGVEEPGAPGQCRPVGGHSHQVPDSGA